MCAARRKLLPSIHTSIHLFTRSAHTNQRPARRRARQTHLGGAAPLVYVVEGEPVVNGDGVLVVSRGQLQASSQPQSRRWTHARCSLVTPGPSTVPSTTMLPRAPGRCLPWLLLGCNSIRLIDMMGRSINRSIDQRRGATNSCLAWWAWMDCCSPSSPFVAEQQRGVARPLDSASGPPRQATSTIKGLDRSIDRLSTKCTPVLLPLDRELAAPFVCWAGRPSLGNRAVVDVSICLPHKTVRIPSCSCCRARVPHTIPPQLISTQPKPAPIDPFNQPICLPIDPNTQEAQDGAAEPNAQRSRVSTSASLSRVRPRKQEQAVVSPSTITSSAVVSHGAEKKAASSSGGGSHGAHSSARSRG